MIAEERKKRRRRANPAALPLLVIKVYCRALIYEVPADASLGRPSVRQGPEISDDARSALLNGKHAAAIYRLGALRGMDLGE